MIVLKLGGSLYHSHYLHAWMSELMTVQDEKIVIVPGGGPFADQVRAADKTFSLKEQHSHAMALLAMQQYAWLLASLGDTFQLISGLDDIVNSKYKQLIWLPYEAIMQECNYPSSWLITSDSLACWLAQRIRAEKLYLIKSQSLNHHQYDPAQHAQFVDGYFAQASMDYQGEIFLYHASQVGNVSANINHD